MPATIDDGTLAVPEMTTLAVLMEMAVFMSDAAVTVVDTTLRDNEDEVPASSVKKSNVWVAVLERSLHVEAEAPARHRENCFPEVVVLPESWTVDELRAA